MADQDSMEGDLVSVTVSCIPGLEFITASECNEVLGVKSEKKTRGRVSFKIPVSSMTKLQNLRSVHHYWLVVSELTDIWSPSDNKEVILEKLEACVDALSWKKALFAFDFYKNIKNKEDEIISENPPCTKGATLEGICAEEQPAATKGNESISEEHPSLNTEGGIPLEGIAPGGIAPKTQPVVTDSINRKERSMSKRDAIKRNSTFFKQRKPEFYYQQPTEITFRVSCTRNGKHTFTSTEAAKYIGSGVKGKFHWEVQLENFDIEILSFIENSDVTIAMKLSTESRHNRNITCFGPTSLRATNAFCMLKLAGIKKG